MYAGGDSQMNGDMPHDGGHGGGHAVGDELRKTGKYETEQKQYHLCGNCAVHDLSMTKMQQSVIDFFQHQPVMVIM